ncbi:tRNA (N(6)-L-threonylcarbamoyladenosine(37)-C(2))-methylthiotransferase MtaB [Kosmotoga sp. DU53]|uniref:tRNA (N(6)-L-threonylcarbamoyladenosine(37)-C(2))- methylthiotransferase MtaB n=1 Tax=Kosmotoga sp. DU53 TaxID=1310160 RepID=UPI0007C52086|nr:tRNA (N(6)-L-threonylcarbamoyladenosine(37)-C(2))-methylthiotransferase MtaB [Kosmotoga sp. DU53]MDK2953197.1 threonylcarbamoyladenosine tRNA methylthiotransferase MtaB [Kosmotoga sp.]OAA23775.1 2-methylthioadenine synthetase [Kosmotoga sp. DU53]
MKEIVSFFTFGCKLNQYETEGMAELLQNDFMVTFDSEIADIFVINSCTVTAEAERKLRQLYRRLKAKNPGSKFVIVGCYSELSAGELKDLGFDLILGIKDKLKIKEFLKENTENTCIKDYFQVTKGPYGRTRAYIGIQDGCLNNCSYCRIRLARGNKIISKPPEVVAEELKTLVEHGFQEIVLTGINIGFYGFGEGYSLISLLKQLVKIEGEWRLRLSSLDPRLVSNELITFMTDNPKIAQHVHLSLQSGSDKVLKSMNRNYTTNDVEQIVALFRSRNNRFSFTTDVIVGFPGETDTDFVETLEFVKRIRFLKVHIFRFSPRPGTKAARMSNQISGNIKKERATVLKKVALEASKDYLNEHVGKESTVLIEKNDGIFSYGYDEFYIPHRVTGSIENGFVKVQIGGIEELEAFSDVELSCRSVAVR